MNTNIIPYQEFICFIKTLKCNNSKTAKELNLKAIEFIDKNNENAYLETRLLESNKYAQIEICDSILIFAEKIMKKHTNLE